MTGMVILVSTAPLVEKKTYNINGNTSEDCFISGRQSISTRGIVILVSTAPLVDRTSVKQEW
jgi:hypothetical protein